MRLAIVTTAVACALGAGVIEAQQDAAPEERRAHNVYVLRGCLTAGREATEPYVLTDASAEGIAPPGAQPGQRPERQTNYLLRPVSGLTESGVGDDELRMHVGFLVEVTLRPPDPQPEPESSPGAAPEGGAALPDFVAEPAPVVFAVSAIARQGGECG